MSHPKTPVAALAALTAALAAPSMAEEAAAPKISDFLADTGATYVGAAGIISLDDKLVTNVSSPRDFVLSIGQGKADGQSKGFGVAFAPGRAKFETFAVDIREYGEKDAGAIFDMKEYGRRWRRLLSSATISYAQNTRAQDGVDYRQRAAALHFEYFYNYNDDPTVAAYRLIAGLDAPQEGTKSCKLLADLRQVARTRALEVSKGKATSDMLVRVLAPDVLANPINPSPVPNLAKERDRAAKASVVVGQAKQAPVAAAAAAEAASQPRPTEKIKDLKKAAQSQADGASASVDNETITSDDLQKLAEACADEALTASRAKWNATKFTLLVGKGDLRGPNAADPRLSLGQHVQLGFQVGSDVWNNSLFTFTARHTARALNLDSVAIGPTYHSGMLWAARYTYGVDADRGMYGIAEVSDARSRNAGVASGAFKWALGFDKKLADSMWVEIRYGKAVLSSGESSETKVVANAKFAFDSELSGLVRK